MLPVMKNSRCCWGLCTIWRVIRDWCDNVKMRMIDMTFTLKINSCFLWPDSHKWPTPWDTHFCFCLDSWVSPLRREVQASSVLLLQLWLLWPASSHQLFLTQLQTRSKSWLLQLVVVLSELAWVLTFIWTFVALSTTERPEEPTSKLPSAPPKSVSTQFTYSPDDYYIAIWSLQYENSRKLWSGHVGRPVHFHWAIFS